MALKPIEKFFEFYDHGTKNNAPTVVFIPGVACSTWMFRDVVPLFLPHYKVLIFNNPGTNGTSIPFNLTVNKIAQKLKECIEFLGLKDCILVGHSMGGFTAQELTQIAPEYVRKMVLVSTSCGGPFTRKEVPRLIKDLGPNFWKRQRDFLHDPEEGINYVFSKYFRKNEPVKYKMFAHRFAEMRPSQVTIIRHFTCASRFSSADYLHKINMPTLVIHGNEDKLIDKEGGQILARKITRAKYLEVDHCGHFPMVENGEFYQNVIAFIEGKKVGKILTKNDK